MAGVALGKAAVNLTLGSGGKAYVSNLDGSASDVQRIDLASNTVDASISYASGGYNHGIDIGPDGYLYQAVNGVGTYKMAADLSTAPVLVGSTATNSRQSATFGPDGKLYTAGYTQRIVLGLDVSTGTETIAVATGTGGLGYATGVLFHPITGNLLVGSIGIGARVDHIIEYTAAGVEVGSFADIGALGVDRPWGMSYYVPEPATVGLLSLGGVLGLIRRKR